MRILLAVFLSISGAWGQATVNLGTASSYAILAGTTITCGGSTVITGNVGLSPGSSITGVPPCTIAGRVDIDNPAAVSAKTALVAAYTDAAGRTPCTMIAADLVGLTFNPGVYCAAAALANSGTVTLDGAGVYIFQIPSTFIPANGSVIALINGATADKIFWQVGSSATIGTTAAVFGNILALASITVNTGAVVNGNLLARNGAVTISGTSTITSPAGQGGGGGSGPPNPEPLGPYANIPWTAGNASADSTNLLAQQMIGLLIATPVVGASTYFTDTATNLCALFPIVTSQAQSGFNFDWYIKNASGSAFSITVAPAFGSGVTVSGTATVAQNFIRHFKIILNECRIGAVAAATIYSLETTAF